MAGSGDGSGSSDEWTTYEPSDRGEVLPPTHVPYGAGSAPQPVYYPGATPRRGSASVLIIAVVVLVFVGAGTLAYFALSGTNGIAGVVGKDKPDVLGEQGYADLVAAVEDRTGDTVVFNAVLYPTYASIDVPEDTTSPRQRNLYWDGSFRDTNILGRADNLRVDLEKVDPEVLGRLVEKAKALVDAPTTWYVIIEGKSTSFTDDGTRIRVYATNPYSETASVSADLSGKVLDTYTSPAE